MKNNRIKNNGITLIALVVTIIVLLILAGISVSMLTGQNGILNRALEAKEKTKIANQDETDKMSSLEALVQTAGTKVTNPSSYGTNPNAQATADGAGKYFDLPDGAKYITGTVDTGVVIEIKDSEFVWVPVEDVVLDTSKTADLPTSADNGTSNGKTYTPMAIRVGDNYKGILYNFSGNNSYLMYGSNNNFQGNETDYKEPDVVSYDTEDYLKDGISTDTLILEYNTMIESVKKYKGFYIARYETGIDNSTKEIVFKNASIKANNVTTASANNSQTNKWYGLYKNLKTFATSDDKVVSSMIWGSQYDAMMNWMTKIGKTVGNLNSSKRNSETVTGKNAYDVINNIYDLYGCYYEWTLEAYSTNNRTCRGDYYDQNISPANRSYGHPSGADSKFSSRATLYIK